MATAPASTRTSKKAEARARILDAFIGLLTEGADDLSHDAVAARAEVGRRTVYRYFPDRAALMDGALLRVRELAGPKVTYPDTAQDLLETLEPVFTGFDAHADLFTLLRTTPQGRQLRLAQKRQRANHYARALADAVKDLPPGDRKLATALLQMLHTTPWLEMHDTWALDGQQIARVTRWALRALLADLKARGRRPLDTDI